MFISLGSVLLGMSQSFVVVVSSQPVASLSSGSLVVKVLLVLSPSTFLSVVPSVEGGSDVLRKLLTVRLESSKVPLGVSFTFLVDTCQSLEIGTSFLTIGFD